MLFGNSLQLLDLARHSPIVNRNNRSCPGGYLSFDIIGVEPESLLLYFSKDRGCPNEEGSIGGSNKCKCRHYNLIPRPYTMRRKYNVQSRSTRVYRNGIFNPDIFGDSLFKLFYLRP